LKVDRFARHQCPLLENAAIALQQGHVAMGHLLPSRPCDTMELLPRFEADRA
jgi:hypothetical protein